MRRTMVREGHEHLDRYVKNNGMHQCIMIDGVETPSTPPFIV
jgi:hypothetical protein